MLQVAMVIEGGIVIYSMLPVFVTILILYIKLCSIIYIVF